MTLIPDRPSSPAQALARQTFAIVRRDWEALLLLSGLIAVVTMGLMSKQWELIVTLLSALKAENKPLINWAIGQIDRPYWFLMAMLVLYLHSLVLVIFTRYTTFGASFNRDGLWALLRRSGRATLQILILGALVLIPLLLVNAIVILLHNILGNFLTSILLFLVVAGVLFIRLVALATVYAAALDVQVSVFQLLSDLKNRPLAPSFSLFIGTFALLQLPDILISPILIGMIDETIQGKWALLIATGFSVFFGMILQMIGLLLARPLLARPGEIRI